MTLGERIRDLRKKHGLSQEQLADKLNVSRQAVQKWETDINEPSIDTLKSIACYFNIEIEYLLYGQVLSLNEHYNKNKVSPKKQNNGVIEKIKSLSVLTKTSIIMLITTILLVIFMLIYVYAISPVGGVATSGPHSGTYIDGLLGYWYLSDVGSEVIVLTIIIGVLITIDLVMFIFLLIRKIGRKNQKLQ